MHLLSPNLVGISFGGNAGPGVWESAGPERSAITQGFCAATRGKADFNDEERPVKREARVATGLFSP